MRLLEPQRRLGDRLEQRMVVDPHLDAAAELIGVELQVIAIIGERSSKAIADPGGEIGGAGSQGRDAKARVRRSCGR